MVWHAGLTSYSMAALHSVGYPLHQASPPHTGDPQLGNHSMAPSNLRGDARVLLWNWGTVSPCFGVKQVPIALCSEAAPDSLSWSRCAWGAALDRPQAPEL